MKEIAQHSGELRVQQLRRVPQHVSGAIGEVVETEVEGYTEHFLASIPFLVFACCGSIETLPASPFPQQSILCAFRGVGSPPLVQVLSEKELVIRGTLHRDDPLVSALGVVGQILSHPAGRSSDALSDIRLKFAALAIDMRNRRRVKLNGRIASVSVPQLLSPPTRDVDSDGVPLLVCPCELRVTVEECMGNCPKYIVSRNFRWAEDTGALASSREAIDRTESVSLTEVAIDILANSTTAFLATVHTNHLRPDENDLGLNHRGGHAGFLRHAHDSSRGLDVLYLPDYSGNRFYQSLGNIETNPCVSLAVWDFARRRMAVVQGRARNLFDSEATDVMPQVSLVTQIDVERCVVLHRAVPFELVGEETPSPYSPPVRRLVGELHDQRQEHRLAAGAVTATLVSGEEVVPGVARLVLDLAGDSAVDESVLDAGTHVILDCAAWAPPKQYRHMDDRCPQRINDDYVRVWTVTSYTTGSAAGTAAGRVASLELMVRQKDRGAITPSLVAAVRSQRIPRSDVPLPVIGFGNTILHELTAALRASNSAVHASAAGPRLVFVLGGIGCTLLLSWLTSWSHKVTLWKSHEERERMRPQVRLSVLFSRKARDGALDTVLQNRLACTDVTVPHDFSVFESPGRRIAKADIDKLTEVPKSTFVLCGPSAFCSTIRQWLYDAGAPVSQVIVEKFDF